MGIPRVAQLSRELAGCGDVDAVARVMLRGLLDIPTVVRAGIALLAPGGRQLHFLPSDPDRLRDQPEWCLIDAYDDLPLNDAIRRGRAVLLGSPDALRRAYPDLAKAQEGNGIRSVCAVPVTGQSGRLGGLLMYRDVVDEDDDSVLALASELADVLAGALDAVRPVADLPEDVSAASGSAGSVVETQALPPDESAPAVARQWVHDALAGMHVGQAIVDAALVCTSELVTNVVIHSGRPSVVSLERTGDEITVRLRHRTDPSPRRLVKAEVPDPLPISGHGLVLVDALSVDWGSDEHDGVTTTWCLLRVDET